MADEYSQPDVDYDHFDTRPHSTSRKRRSSKGDVKGQRSRYRAKHRLTYNDYMRRWVANKRKLDRMYRELGG